MDRTSRSLWFTAPGAIELRDEAVISGDDEVVVTAVLSAVSHGTEMLFYRGPFPSGADLEAIPGLGATDYPVKYGYMSMGITDDGRRVFAFAPHQTILSLAENRILQIPDSVTDEDAVLYPSAETALQIVHDAAPRLGESVAVIGLGMIGTLVCDLLRRTGAAVIGVDRVGARLDRVSTAGFPVIDANRHDAATRLIGATDGGPDIAINVSGSDSGLQLAIDAVRFEGTVVEASWFGSAQSRLRLGGAFHRRRIKLRASQVSHLNPSMQPRWNRERRTKAVFGLLPELRPSRLISHRLPFSQAADAFRMIRDDPSSVMQIVFRMEE